MVDIIISFKDDREGLIYVHRQSVMIFEAFQVSFKLFMLIAAFILLVAKIHRPTFFSLAVN